MLPEEELLLLDEEVVPFNWLGLTTPVIAPVFWIENTISPFVLIWRAYKVDSITQLGIDFPEV